MTACRNYSRFLTIDGEQRSLVNWAEAYGISKQLLWERLDNGWEDEKAVTTPARKYRSKKGEPSGEGINGSVGTRGAEVSGNQATQTRRAS